MPLLALALLLLLLFDTSNSGAAELQVNLDKVPPQGSVVVALFDSEASFEQYLNPVSEHRFESHANNQYIISNIPVGSFGIMVYFDENDNLQLDRNFLDIPNEPIGLANAYQPRGPIDYERTTIVFNGLNDMLSTNVLMRKPLGEKGGLAIGVQAVSTTPIYRGSTDVKSQVIPSLTYTHDRVQIIGAGVRLGLAQYGYSKLFATGTYRFGAYAEDDSTYLTGMDDRDGTLMMGLSLEVPLPFSLRLSASYEHDAVDTIGGGEAKLALNAGAKSGSQIFFYGAGLSWLSDELSMHDFGVSQNEAREGREAYRPGATLSVDANLGTLISLSDHWLVSVIGNLKVFDSKINASPIVSSKYTVNLLTSISYAF